MKHGIFGDSNRRVVNAVVDPMRWDLQDRGDLVGTEKSGNVMWVGQVLVVLYSVLSAHRGHCGGQHGHAFRRAVTGRGKLFGNFPIRTALPRQVKYDGFDLLSV